MYLTDELFHAEWVPLIALDQIVKRYMQGIGYVDQQVNGYTPSAKFEFPRWSVLMFSSSASRSCVKPRSLRARLRRHPNST